MTQPSNQWSDRLLEQARAIAKDLVGDDAATRLRAAREWKDFSSHVGSLVAPTTVPDLRTDGGSGEASGPVSGTSDGELAGRRAIDWPEPLSEDDARSALQGWARGRKLVRNDVFDGPLSVEDATSIRFVLGRLVENRSVERFREPGRVTPSGLIPRTAAEALVVPEPDEIKDAKFVAVFEDSIGHEACSACVRGSNPCGRCRGTGWRPCRPQQTCPVCHGRGQTTELEHGENRLVTCRRCSGQGLVMCDDCAGRGEVRCRSCDGRGLVTCSSCRGEGCFTTSVGIVVRRTVHEDEARYGTPAVTKGVTSQKYSFEPAVIPAGLPEPVVAELRALVEAPEPGPVLRSELVAELIPATAVHYIARGKERIAYVSGKERVVTAPAVRDPSRVAITVTLAGLVVVAIVAIVLISGWSG